MFCPWSTITFATGQYGDAWLALAQSCGSGKAQEQADLAGCAAQTCCAASSKGTDANAGKAATTTTSAKIARPQPSILPLKRTSVTTVAMSTGLGNEVAAAADAAGSSAQHGRCQQLQMPQPQQKRPIYRRQRCRLRVGPVCGGWHCQHCCWLFSLPAVAAAAAVVGVGVPTAVAVEQATRSTHRSCCHRCRRHPCHRPTDHHCGSHAAAAAVVACQRTCWWHEQYCRMPLIDHQVR